MSIDSSSISPNIDPPEEKLSTLQTELSVGKWSVIARNRRVNRDWEKLQQQYPENTTRCYEYLCSTPMKRLPGRIFPLKGKRYRGAWEYELTKGERVFYVPNPSQMKVVVYYAGEHPKSKNPIPPQGNRA